MTESQTNSHTHHLKKISIKIRIDDVTAEKLKTCSEKLGISRSEVARKGIQRLYDDLIR